MKSLLVNGSVIYLVGGGRLLVGGAVQVAEEAGRAGHVDNARPGPESGEQQLARTLGRAQQTRMLELTKALIPFSYPINGVFIEHPLFAQ